MLETWEINESKLLKMNVSEAEVVTIVRVLREERPSLSLTDCIYVAKLLKRTHAHGVIRGQVVNNA